MRSIFAGPAAQFQDTTDSEARPFGLGPVANREVRIIGSKSNLLQTLTAAAGAKLDRAGVRSSVLKWRKG
jgi:hypothetical protein